MLRALLQLALLAAGIGLAASNLDSQTTQKIASAIRDLGAAFRQGNIPGSQEAASGMDQAADAVQSASIAQARVAREPGRDAPEGQVAHPKAFYNKLTNECQWEKVIDPEDGTVRCSVPERRQAVRER